MTADEQKLKSTYSQLMKQFKQGVKFGMENFHYGNCLVCKKPLNRTFGQQIKYHKECRRDRKKCKKT